MGAWLWAVSGGPLQCSPSCGTVFKDPVSVSFFAPRQRGLPPPLPPPPPLQGRQWVAGTDALEGEGPQRRPQGRFDRRLEEVAEAVGGGYCRLQMPLKLALAVRETVAGRRLGAMEGGGGLPPFQCISSGRPLTAGSCR